MLLATTTISVRSGSCRDLGVLCEDSTVLTSGIRPANRLRLLSKVAGEKVQLSAESIQRDSLVVLSHRCTRLYSVPAGHRELLGQPFGRLR